MSMTKEFLAQTVKKSALAIGGRVESGNLLGRQLLAYSGEVDRSEVGVELVAPVEVDVLPGDGGYPLEDLRGGQRAATFQFRQHLGQDQGVVVDHQPGAFAPDLLFVLGPSAETAAVGAGDGPAIEGRVIDQVVVEAAETRAVATVQIAGLEPVAQLPYAESNGKTRSIADIRVSMPAGTTVIADVCL